MKTNTQIFIEVSRKINPNNFDFGQFIKYNKLLFQQIIESMTACQQEYRHEIKRLKELQKQEDIEYNAMRNYAKELEHKLGINQESGK